MKKALVNFTRRLVGQQEALRRIDSLASGIEAIHLEIDQVAESLKHLDLHADRPSHDASSAAAAPYWPDLDYLLRLHVSQADLVLDIGANVGSYTAILAEIGAETHAFEPNPALAAELRRKFGGLGRVFIHDEALSDTVGEATFYLDTRPDLPAVSSSLMKLDDLHASGAVHPVTVHTNTIDAFAATLARPPTLIKIDAEGHEPSILAGGRITIERHRPRIVFEMWENHWPRFIETFDWLSTQYRLVRVRDGIDANAFYRTNQASGGADILALPL